jgi:hypothetical protein
VNASGGVETKPPETIDLTEYLVNRKLLRVARNSAVSGQQSEGSVFLKSPANLAPTNAVEFGGVGSEGSKQPSNRSRATNFNPFSVLLIEDDMDPSPASRHSGF